MLSYNNNKKFKFLLSILAFTIYRFTVFFFKKIFLFFQQISVTNREEPKQIRRFPVIALDSNSNMQFLNSLLTTSDFEPNVLDDTLDNRYQVLYDA